MSDITIQPKVAIVYHSGYGHTAAIADRLALGAGAKSKLITIDENGEITAEEWETLDQADAIVFGSPTYMGNVSWQFKRFADATSKVWFTRGWQDKIFGGFTNSASPSGDKQVAMVAMQTLASQHGGIWVSLGLAPANLKASTHAELNHIGGSLGPMLRSPADASVEDIPEGDLATAEAYGRRVAAIAARFAHEAREAELVAA